MKFYFNTLLFTLERTPLKKFATTDLTTVKPL
jgi:hypothetical protein